MSLKSGQLRFLTSDELYEIHMASLEILGQVGVKFLSQKALQILEGAGAQVDFKEEVARIPEYLVKEAIRKAPSSCTVYGRDFKHKMKLGDDQVYFGMAGWLPYVLDLETGKRREGTLADVEQFFKLGDYSKNIHFLDWAVWPKDIPESVVHAYGLFMGFKNTTKPLDGYIHGESPAEDNIRMASIVAGGEEELRKRPLLLSIENPTSPLQHSKEMIEGLMVYTKYGQPLVIAPEAQSGATAPVSLAGLLVQQNVEILSGIVLAELVNPSTPMIYGTVSTIADMKTGNIALGAVEAGLINAATAQLAHYYNLPSRGTAGTTDSKIPDVQAGLEKSMTLIMAALSGIDFIYSFAGTLESTLTMSYEQFLIDDELAGMVARAVRGVRVDDEMLAVDVIKKVGPGHHYLTQKHTIENFMKEHYIPKIINREKRETWEKLGAKDLREIARNEVKKILKEHQPEPLDSDVEMELKKILEEIEKRSRGNI
ncbi:MAG: trimethylamine methyltransferase family protein [Candidatus Hadarchaeum sp.]|uniref:trimethylamine methyltransferase family protein n=1 Tax=Candidatus Hadarchaeum sp. TaxID=2883567 RepID=UPI0031731C5D